MASTRESNTMAEGLQKVLNEIVKMKVLPDSDLGFLVDLETNVLKYLRPPTADPNQQPSQPPTQQGGMPPGMPGAGGPMDGAMQQVMQPPAAAPMGMTNPDELRRMLASR